MNDIRIVFELEFGREREGEGSEASTALEGVVQVDHAELRRVFVWLGVGCGE